MEMTRVELNSVVVTLRSSGSGSIALRCAISRSRSTLDAPTSPPLKIERPRSRSLICDRLDRVDVSRNLIRSNPDPKSNEASEVAIDPAGALELLSIAEMMMEISLLRANDAWGGRWKRSTSRLVLMDLLDGCDSKWINRSSSKSRSNPVK